MFFLLRTGFWLSLVLLALPLGAPGEGSVNPLQALFAAKEAIGDVAGLCERKPEVCATGRAAFQTIGSRAQEASRLASALMDDAAPADSDPIATGAIARPDIPVPQPRPAYD